MNANEIMNSVENAEMAEDMRNGGWNWVNSPLMVQLMEVMADEMPIDVQMGNTQLPEEWIAERVS